MHETEPMESETEEALKPVGARERLRSILSFVAMVALVMGFVWVMKSFVYQAYSVPTGSMETTIMPGDMLFAEKISYRSHTPEQGDIVTFLDPRAASEERVLIKRVIAVGGQTIELIDGSVYIDGTRLDESYTQGGTYPLTSTIVTYPYTVPEGHVFVMGDNRTNSTDSRAFGAVSLDAVLERAVFIYWPFSHFGSLYKE